MKSPSSTDWAREIANEIEAGWTEDNKVVLIRGDRCAEARADLENRITKALLSVAKKNREEAIEECANIAETTKYECEISDPSLRSRAARNIRALLAPKTGNQMMSYPTFICRQIDDTDVMHCFCGRCEAARLRIEVDTQATTIRELREQALEMADRLADLKNDLNDSENEAKEYKKAAKSWMADCDALKEKYEPTELVLSEAKHEPVEEETK